MTSIVLHCPGCDQAYKMSAEQIGKYAGRMITCKKCKAPFNFDAAMDAAANTAGDADSVAEPAVSVAVSAPAAVVPPAPPAPPVPTRQKATQLKDQSTSAPAAPASSDYGADSSSGDDSSDDANNEEGAIGVAAPAYPPAPAHPAIEQKAAAVAVQAAILAAAPARSANSLVGLPKGSIADYLAFRAMVTPLVIQILFWVATALCILLGLVYLVGGVVSMTTSVPLGLGLVVGGLILLVGGPILTRVCCEVLIVVFRISDTLREIRDRLGSEQ